MQSSYPPTLSNAAGDHHSPVMTSNPVIYTRNRPLYSQRENMATHRSQPRNERSWTGLRRPGGRLQRALNSRMARQRAVWSVWKSEGAVLHTRELSGGSDDAGSGDPQRSCTNQVGCLLVACMFALLPPTMVSAMVAPILLFGVMKVYVNCSVPLRAIPRQASSALRHCLSRYKLIASNTEHPFSNGLCVSSTDCVDPLNSTWPISSRLASYGDVWPVRRYRPCSAASTIVQHFSKSLHGSSPVWKSVFASHVKTNSGMWTAFQ